MNVRFERDYINQKYNVFMFDNSNNGRRVFFKGDNTVVTVEDGQMLKHEDVIFCSIPDDALKAFADELSNIGIKTDNDHKMAGTLEATKYHLEDMRKLAKVVS